MCAKIKKNNSSAKQLILILLYSGINVKILYVIRDLVGNNNNGIANCIFYLTKESNQPEDGS